MKRTIAFTVAILIGTASTAAAATSPSVKTGSASSIKQTSVVLNGTINPNGAKTTYWFEWGLTKSYGSTSAVHTLKAGTKAVSVHVTVSGLSPDVRYQFRLFAQNASGSSSGADHTFKTKGLPLPVAETEPASSITTNSAIISGVVDPNGESTPTEFAWGDSPTSLSTVPGPTVAATTPLQTIALPLTGLEDGTTFYYQVLVYRSGVGWLPTATAQFTTHPSSRPYASVDAITRPHQNRRTPFTFATGGHISGPFPAGAQCSGTVTLRYVAAGRTVRQRSIPVQPSCGFLTVTSFDHTFVTHRGGRRPRVQKLEILVSFRGNRYLAPKRHTDHTTMG